MASKVANEKQNFHETHSIVHIIIQYIHKYIVHITQSMEKSCTLNIICRYITIVSIQRQIWSQQPFYFISLIPHTYLVGYGELSLNCVLVFITRTVLFHTFIVCYCSFHDTTFRLQLVNVWFSLKIFEVITQSMYIYNFPTSDYE